MITIIQTSLSKDSQTATLAKKAQSMLEAKGVKTFYIDLREQEMEFCDGRKIEEYSKDMQNIAKILEQSKGYLFAYPVYNYSVSGVGKNFIDIFSKYMDSKFVGILHNSGGIRSANEGVGELMKSFALHNNITTVQPPIHSYRADFEDGELTNAKVIEKIELLVDNISEKIN